MVNGIDRSDICSDIRNLCRPKILYEKFQIVANKEGNKWYKLAQIKKMLSKVSNQ